MCYVLLFGYRVTVYVGESTSCHSCERDVSLQNSSTCLLCVCVCARTCIFMVVAGLQVLRHSFLLGNRVWAPLARQVRVCIFPMVNMWSEVSLVPHPHSRSRLVVRCCGPSWCGMPCHHVVLIVSMRHGEFMYLICLIYLMWFIDYSNRLVI